MYLKTVKDKIGAEARLLDVFSAGLGVQFGKYNLDELVNVDAEKLKLDTMITDAVSYARARTEKGQEILLRDAVLLVERSGTFQ